MAEPHLGTLPVGTKHCRVCAEPINRLATKCIHCGSEQSVWRQRMGLSSTVLSLLVALIAVLTAAIPVIVNAITPDSSRLTLAITEATGSLIGIVVFNSGNRPGGVSGANLAGDTFPVLALNREGVTSQASYIVDPGKGVQINFTPVPTPGINIDEMYKAKTCKLTIYVTEFGETKPDERDIRVDCQQVFGLIAGSARP